MRKAQAALEYLMSHSYMILIVLGMIGALGYYVFDEDIFRQDYCITGPGISCNQYQFTKDRVFIEFTNSGKDMEDIEVDLKCGPYYSGHAQAGKAMVGQSFQAVFPGYDGDSADCEMHVSYKSAGSTYEKKISGEINQGTIRTGGSPLIERCDVAGDNDFDGCDDDKDNDCGNTEYEVGNCNNGLDDDCDGRIDCTEGLEDQSCLDAGECMDSCTNDELDSGESDTMTGSWSGPYPNDCGGPDSGCPQCEVFRPC